MSGYPTPPPWYFYPPQPYNQGMDSNDYVKHLKRELKRAKRGTDMFGNKTGGKKEEKYVWWKKMEITVLLFFLSPFIFIGYLGVIKLAWLVAKSLVN